MPEQVRRFTHVNGFKDDVAWIEYYKDNDLLYVLDDGNKVIGNAYSIDGMEQMVSEGKWVELKPFIIYDYPEQQIFKDKFKIVPHIILKAPSKRNSRQW